MPCYEWAPEPVVPSIYDHVLAVRQGKYERRKRRDSFKEKDRVRRLVVNGKATQFKPGQLVGSKSPCWKGGPFAKLGLTVEGYDRILKAQGGKCALCGRPPKRIRLSVDHDHKTGKIRGLLCFRCNYGIGWFQDDAKRLQGVAEYLNSPKDWRDMNVSPK